MIEIEAREVKIEPYFIPLKSAKKVNKKKHQIKLTYQDTTEALSFLIAVCLNAILTLILWQTETIFQLIIISVTTIGFLTWAIAKFCQRIVRVSNEHK